MTRRGIVQCDLSTEGYVSLPRWVESADAGHGPHLTRSDVVGILVDLNLVGTESMLNADQSTTSSNEPLVKSEAYVGKETMLVHAVAEALRELKISDLQLGIAMLRSLLD